MLLEVTVENHLVALFPGVDPMEDVRGFGFEPADLLRLPQAGDDAKAARHVPVHAHHMVTLLQAFGIPEERQIVDDGKRSVNAMSWGSRGPGSGIGTGCFS